MWDKKVSEKKQIFVVIWDCPGEKIIVYINLHVPLKSVSGDKRISKVFDW